MERNYYEIGGGDEEATPCDYCGAPVVAIEFSGPSDGTGGGTDFFDSDNEWRCNDELEDWEDPNEHIVKNWYS